MKQRHRHREFQSFLRQNDNSCTHKCAKVGAWLAKRPRSFVHYTPPYATWRNQVVRWFGIIMQQATRRGSFLSIKGQIALARRASACSRSTS